MLLEGFKPKGNMFNTRSKVEETLVFTILLEYLAQVIVKKEKINLKQISRSILIVLFYSYAMRIVTMLLTLLAKAMSL